METTTGSRNRRVFLLISGGITSELFLLSSIHSIMLFSKTASACLCTFRWSEPMFLLYVFTIEQAQ